jgi:hypothetical protein
MGAVEAVDEVRRGRAARERQSVADDHGLFTSGTSGLIITVRSPNR